MRILTRIGHKYESNIKINIAEIRREAVTDFNYLRILLRWH
jgi:hypothetical protein